MTCIRNFGASALLVAALLPTHAAAQSATDLAVLRQEIDALRASYEQRLQALEARLRVAEAKAQTAPPPSLPPTPPVTPPATPPTTNAFNPAISLILSGTYARTKRDPATYAIGGFGLPAGAEVGPGQRGFGLGETELGLSASIDPFWRGAVSLAVAPDDGISVEEAFVQTTALGRGFTFKAGRFFSGIGYLNSQHAHVWDFVDAPLAYQALLGGQYGDDGVQLSWVAPIDHYLELGAELGRGRSFPGGDNARNGAGMRALWARTGGDIGTSHNWRLGVSALSTKASEQALSIADATGQGVDGVFDGRTRTWVVDGVWKWAPEGNATRTNFKLQGEWLRNQRRGQLQYDPSGADLFGAWRSTPSGWYVQGLYQFMPAWRVGLRTERLDPGRATLDGDASLFDVGGFRPRKDSLMLDVSTSEFARWRLQFARDRARLGETDNQFFIQYQMSLGAHGAHGY